MKKLIVILLSALMLFGTTSCNGDVFNRSEYESDINYLRDRYIFLEDELEELGEFVNDSIIVELYINAEPDGDYEMLYKTANGLFYRQVLGGEITTDIEYDKLSDIMSMEHFAEFVRII
jgi:hypothetical protein